jgi:hypothetical protein
MRSSTNRVTHPATPFAANEILPSFSTSTAICPDYAPPVLVSPPDVFLLHESKSAP